MNSSAPLPTNAWALTDGNSSDKGSTATTALDSITGAAATVTGNASWASDSTFATDINLDGTSGDVTPPATSVTSTANTISVWFRTTSPGVLISSQSQPLSAGATTTGSYSPILYIGTDGFLYGHIPTATIGLATVKSSSVVDDGSWHHAVITATPKCSLQPPIICQTTQTLYLDDQAPVTLGSIGGLTSLSNVNFGAGISAAAGQTIPQPARQAGPSGFPTSTATCPNITFYNTPLSAGGGGCDEPVC